MSTYRHGNWLSRWLRWPHLMWSKTGRCHYIELCDCRPTREEGE